MRFLWYPNRGFRQNLNLIFVYVHKKGGDVPPETCKMLTKQLLYGMIRVKDTCICGILLRETEVPI